MFSPPRIWLPVTVPALAAVDHQSQIAGRGGAGGIGHRERSGRIGLVGEHQGLAGNGDLQVAAGLGFKLAVDLLDDVAQGRIAAYSREVDGPRRWRAAVGRGKGIGDIAQSGGCVRLHAPAVVQPRELEVAGEREDVTAGDGVAAGACGRIDVREPQRGRGRAAAHLLDLETRDVIPGVVGQDDMPVVGRGGDVDRARTIDRLDHVVDVLGIREVDDGAGAAAIGDAYFTGSETLPAVDFREADAWIDRVAVTESKRSSAQGLGGALEAGAQ